MDLKEHLYLMAERQFPNPDLEIIELLTPGNLLQKCKKPTLQPSHGFPSSRAHFVRKIEGILNTSKYNILFSLHQPKKAKNRFDAEVIRIFTVFLSKVALSRAAFSGNTNMRLSPDWLDGFGRVRAHFVRVNQTHPNI